MKGIPSIIINSLVRDGFVCERCKAPFKEECIKAVGVRISKKDGMQQMLFVEYRCDCKDSVSVEFQPMSLMDFAMMILHSFDPSLSSIVEEELTGNPMYASKRESLAPESKPEPIVKKKEKPPSTKISDKELSETVKYLEGVKYFDDVLESMGIYNNERPKVGKRKGNRGEQ